MHACRGSGWWPLVRPTSRSRTSTQTSAASTARPTTTATGATAAPVHPFPNDPAAPRGAHTAARPARTASTGNVAIRMAIAAYAHSHLGRFSGRTSSHTASPPGPARRGPGPGLTVGHVAEDGRPGASSARAPIEAPAACLAPTRARSPTAMPQVQDVPVQPVAAEVDLRLDGALVPEGEHARHGRHGMQVDMPADLGPEGAA